MLSGLVTAILTDFAERTILGIRTNLETLNATGRGPMDTTGKMKNSLGFRIDAEGLTIFSSEKYFTVVETGRKPTSPGASAGSPTVRENIENWIVAKGITPDGITVKSLAYLISRKIHEEGSLLYRQGGKSGVISNEINDKRIKEGLTDQLTDKLREFIINEFVRKAIA